MPQGSNNKTHRVGSRRKVFNGSAERTAGGLRKDDLIKNAAGRIVSKKRHTTMKQRHGGGNTEPSGTATAAAKPPAKPVGPPEIASETPKLVE
jgi:hypothetical protein